MNKSKKEEINAYIHCKNCMSGNLAIGWTEKGFMVWCEVCEKKVAHYDLLGNKVKSI